MVLAPQGAGRVDRCQHWFLWPFSKRKDLGSVNKINRENAQAVRIARYLGLFVAAALCGVFSVFAGEILVTPDEAALEKWAIAAFFQTSETEPEIEVSGSSSIQIPTSGGGNATVFSQADTDVTLEQSLELAGLTLVMRPKRLRYTVSIAQVRRFELEFASGPVTNSLRADDGFRAGVGIAGSFVPMTMASVGFGWSVDYRYLAANLDRFESAGTVSPANQRVRQDEIQASVTGGWRWKTIEPYAGLKLFRQITRLTDRATRETVRGEADGVSPVVGIEWTPVAGESAVVEASFIDEESVTASWVVKF
jgi:hypothetical protein